MATQNGEETAVASCSAVAVRPARCFALPPDPALRGRVNRAHPFCRSRTGPDAA